MPLEIEGLDARDDERKVVALIRDRPSRIAEF